MIMSSELLTDMMNGVFVTNSNVKWKEIIENILFYSRYCVDSVGNL